MTDAMLPPEVTEAVQRREMYRANAVKALEAYEYPKAAELTWGAATQEWIRSAFFLKGEVIGRWHAQYRDLCTELATLTGDRFYVDGYNELNHLHNFFYRDSALAAPEVKVPELMHLADEMIEKLEELIAAKLSTPETE